MSGVARAWATALAATHLILLITLIWDYEVFSQVASYSLALSFPGARTIWVLISANIVVAGLVGAIFDHRLSLLAAWGFTGPTHLTFALSLFAAGFSYVGGMMWLLVGAACYCALILALQGRLDETP